MPFSKIAIGNKWLDSVTDRNDEWKDSDIDWAVEMVIGKTTNWKCSLHQHFQVSQVALLD